MRINTNTAAMNTYTKYSAAANAKASALEKLSSGSRINTAADDAAGLAISNKMTAQISGMKQAREASTLKRSRWDFPSSNSRRCA